jgi:CHAT domain-containing protein
VRFKEDSEKSGSGIRVQLRTSEFDKVVNVPWELMYDGHDFVSMSVNTPVVRYLELARTPKPLIVNPPLRMLVTMSLAEDSEKLDVDAERSKLLSALDPLVALELLEVDFSVEGTLLELQRMLRRAQASGSPYHIWHYVGHGRHSKDTNEAELVFRSRAGTTQPVTGFDLGALFNGHLDLRLVVLNACEGARAAAADPFSSVSAAIVQHGVPAVVAMQFQISDDAAILFAEDFYSAMVDGLPIEAAVTEARRSIFFSGNRIEWATPVLFIRSESGVLFRWHDFSRS